MPESLYLDAIATTRLSDGVREKMLPFLSLLYGIPTGAHSRALDIRDEVESARESVLLFCDAPEKSMALFTGSGTEANNLGLMGYIRHRGIPSRIVTSEIEHPSIMGACLALSREGHDAVFLPVDTEGVLCVDRVSEVLREGDLFVTHLANYDVGTKQDLITLGEICRNQGATFMVDATYGAGWNDFSMRSCCADMVTFSPHRFFGPPGVGCLVFHSQIKLEPIFYGGSQEWGLRPGTSSPANIIGAGESCRLALQECHHWMEQTKRLQGVLMSLLSEKLKGFRLNGAPTGPWRDPHHVSLAIDHVEGEAVLLNLDLKGLQLTCNTGCLSPSEKVSPVLRAIGLDKETALGTLVMGLLPEHTEGDMLRAVELMISAVERVRHMSATGL